MPYDPSLVARGLEEEDDYDDEACFEDNEDYWRRTLASSKPHLFQIASSICTDGVDSDRIWDSSITVSQIISWGVNKKKMPTVCNQTSVCMAWQIAR